jgi:4-amino-4-deoxy-L-arabinose transferase-like glycosyltransferase
MRKPFTAISLSSDLLVLIAIATIAISIQIIWLLLDKSVPAWDDASHFTNALNYQRVLTHIQIFSSDWWHELWAQSTSYTAPFVYILTVPFLNIFGKTLDAGILVNILFIITIVSTTYCLSRSAFDRQVSIWASGLCLMFPALINVQTIYMLDYGVVAMSCLTFLMLTLWKYASTKLKSWQWSLMFGITFGCLMLSKPTGFLFLLFPSIFLLYSFIKNRNWLGIFQIGVAIIISWSIFGGWFSQNWLTVLTSAISSNAIGSTEGDPGGNTLAGWLYYFKILPELISLPFLVTTSGMLILSFAKRFSVCAGRQGQQLDADNKNHLLYQNRQALWLLLYCLGGYFFCSLASNKDSRFILPIFPVFSIFLAYSFNLFQTTWARRLRWATVGTAGLLLLINLFYIPSVDNLLTIPYVRSGLIHRTDVNSDFPHHKIIQEIIHDRPYLRSTIGVLASSSTLNTENLNLAGSIANFQVYARYFVNTHTTERTLIEKDLKFVNWYITKTGDLGYINKQLVPAIEQNPQIQLARTWQMPDASMVKLYRRKNMPVSIEPISAQIEKIQLEKVTISPTSGRGINTTYQLSGDRELLQNGLLILTWQCQNRTWYHDRAIGLGNLYLQHSKLATFRVSENSVMFAPEKLPLDEYQLTATYLDRKTEKTFPLSVPKIQIDLTTTNAFAPDSISKLQQLSKSFSQGKIDLVFSEINTLNQYDPTQDYLAQAQQAIKYRIDRGESQLDLKYTLALTQAIQRQIEPLLANLTTIARQDDRNPYAWVYLGFVRLYNWQPQAAEAAFQVAEKLPSPPKELATLKVISALFRFDLLQSWQRWQESSSL